MGTTIRKQKTFPRRTTRGIERGKTASSLASFLYQGRKLPSLDAGKPLLPQPIRLKVAESEGFEPPIRLPVT